jgi:hypothetical protein
MIISTQVIIHNTNIKDGVYYPHLKLIAKSCIDYKKCIELDINLGSYCYTPYLKDAHGGWITPNQLEDLIDGLKSIVELNKQENPDWPNKKLTKKDRFLYKVKHKIYLCFKKITNVFSGYIDRHERKLADQRHYKQMGVNRDYIHTIY